MKKTLLTSLCLVSIICQAQKTKNTQTANREAKPDTTHNNLRLDSDAATGIGGLIDRATRSFEIQGPDLWLGTNDGRSQGVKTKATNNPNRALVHGDDDQLILNFGGDFEGGIISGSKIILTANNLNENYIEIKQAYNNQRRASDGSQRYLQPGDDSYLTDLDIENTMGLCGTVNKNEGGLKLGATGAALFGKTGNLGINTNNPVATLHVNGFTLLGPDPGTQLMTQLNNCASVPANNTVPPLRLFANGTIGCTELRVNPTSWCDYVFEKNYKLRDLKEVETYIMANKHLPEVPSEKEVQDNGVYVAEMFKAHMKKIEELTLYLIEQNKKIEQLNSDNQKLSTEISNLKEVIKLKN